MRRAKIIATIGPSSSSKEMLTQLILAGMNVCRLNMSHGTYEAHQQVIKNIREASKETGYEVAILADLQGPKIRVDKLPEPLKLESGSEWVIGASKVRDLYPEYQNKYIPTIYENLVADCHDGARILFDDGLIIAEAVSRDRDVYKIKVSIGGTLKSNKGINLPDCEVSAPAFTEKDREDLMFALKEGADLVHSLDSSKKAIVLTEENVELNNFGDKHMSIVADAMEYMKELPEDYDIIVLDPPAFAKHRDKRHKAIQGYKRLNAHAIRQIKPGGIIFTFSCSQVVDKFLFTNTVIAAAIESGRNVRILEQLHQPADHPINAFHPEGEYLKGLVLQVD